MSLGMESIKGHLQGKQDGGKSEMEKNVISANYGIFCDPSAIIRLISVAQTLSTHPR
jgi:hypothetical protein